MIMYNNVGDNTMILVFLWLGVFCIIMFFITLKWSKERAKKTEELEKDGYNTKEMVDLKNVLVDKLRYPRAKLVFHPERKEIVILEISKFDIVKTIDLTDQDLEVITEATIEWASTFMRSVLVGGVFGWEWGLLSSLIPKTQDVALLYLSNNDWQVTIIITGVHSKFEMTKIFNKIKKISGREF